MKIRKKLAALVAVLLVITCSACTARSGSEKTAENTNGMADAVKSAPDYTGNWTLDGDATMANLSSHGDIYVLFGSGLRDYGAEMIISEDGTFSCRVGVGFYLDGNWKSDGETLTAEGKDGFSEDASVSFVPVEIDGVEELCMTYDNENVYWKRDAAFGAGD